jgi:hypothetical protein
MIPSRYIQNPFRKKKAHIFKKKKIIRKKVHKNSAPFPSYIRVQKCVLKNFKKVGKRKQKNNLIIEPNRFRLFYIPKTKRNKHRKTKKRKPYLLKRVHSKNVNGKLSLRRSFFLPPFLPLRKSLTERYKKFFNSLPLLLYKKKDLRKKRSLKKPKFGSKRLFFYRKRRNKVTLMRNLLSFASRPLNFRPYQKFQKKVPFKKLTFFLQAIKYRVKKFRRSCRARK